MLRFLNLILVGGLIAAAVVVYDVKYTSTYDAQKVARLDAEIRAEREKIASLKAEWSMLSSPERIQRLASRYLGMKPLPVTHIGPFASLPERVSISTDPIGDIIDSLDGKGGKRDPIGNIIDKMESAQSAEPETTGSITPPQPDAAAPTEQPEDAPNSEQNSEPNTDGGEQDN